VTREASARAVIQRRKVRQRELIDLAEEFARELDSKLGVRSVVVYGSVARGDFNVWSDVDVLVIADSLPKEVADRPAALGPAPPGVQPIAWTPEELTAAVTRRNPIATEAATKGVVVLGADHWLELIG
jgi:predicted nucleotidyltransferase